MNDEVIAERTETDRQTTGGWAICLGDRRPSEVRWLWPGRVPLGKITLLSGDPGLGKSLVTLDLAARVTRGGAMPEAVGEGVRCQVSGVSLALTPDTRLLTPTEPGSVILLSAEDDIDDTIVPRLLAAGADMSRIHIPGEAGVPSASHGRLDLKHGLERFEKVVAAVPDCRLVIIDPISAYCGNIDACRNADVRALLAPLAALAAQRGFAVLMVNHLNKSAQGPLIYRSMGSLAFAAAARNVLAVIVDPKNARARICLSVKSNLNAPSPGLRFTIESTVAGVCDPGGPASQRPATEAALPRVVWQTEAVDYSAEEGAAEDERAAESSGLREAREWLQQVLAEGPMASKEIKRLATEAGISHRTLWRAKDRLGIAASCVAQSGPGAKYVWQLTVAGLGGRD
jgi:putative DNA primase/helicase